MDDGTWFGSLENIDPERGYWLRIDQGDLFELTTYESPEDLVYTLHYGNNLISYIGDDNLFIQDAISDDFEEFFLTIIGQGQAAQRLPNGLWVGSLTHLNTLKGYWIKISEGIDFQWNYDEELIRSSYNYQKPKEYLNFDEKKLKINSLVKAEGIESPFERLNIKAPICCLKNIVAPHLKLTPLSSKLSFIFSTLLNSAIS